MNAVRLAAASGALAVVAMLAGCSQLAALAPVGGNGLAEVRFGAIDVLQREGVDLLRAPVCAKAATGPAVTCTGATLDGRPISVSSSTADDAQLEIVVGDETLFRGPLADVLDEAARG